MKIRQTLRKYGIALVVMLMLTVSGLTIEGPRVVPDVAYGFNIGGNFQQLQVDTIADLRNTPGDLYINKYAKVGGYYVRGDGGGGPKRVWKEGQAPGFYVDDGGSTIVPGDGSGAWVLNFSGAINIKWFGAKGDGLNDDTDAIERSLKLKNIYVPSGTYLLTSTIKINIPGTTIIGEDSRTATFLHGGNYGDTLLFERDDPLTSRISFCVVRNLRFFVSDVHPIPTSGNHISMTRPQAVEMSNLDVSEMYGGILFKGGAGVFLDNIKVNSGQFYTSKQSGSYLVKFASATTTGSNEHPSEYYATNVNWRTDGAPYIENGVIIQASDGINISNGHIGFTSDAGLLVKPINATDSLNGINFTNIHFDGNFNTLNGVLFDEPSLGFHTGASFGATFTGCQYSIASGSGIKFNLDSVNGASITGGRCSSNAMWGITLSRGSGFNISGVVFGSNGTNLAGTGQILISNDVSDVTIDGTFKGNYYRGVQINDSADRVNVSGVFSNATIEDVFMNSSSINHKLSFVTDKTTSITSAASIYIPHGKQLYSITGGTAISGISGFSRSQGRYVTLRFVGITTVTAGPTLLLSGDFVSTANDTLTLVNDGSAWLEVSRSVN